MKDKMGGYKTCLVIRPDTIEAIKTKLMQDLYPYRIKLTINIVKASNMTV